MPDLYGNLTPQGVLNGSLQTIVYADNYNDLINKPSINSVELQGNKTAADLGLLTAGDIPVESVNGKQGVVILDGDDIEYSAGVSISDQIDNVAAAIPSVPVLSVNSKTGAVVLDGDDIEYEPGTSVNSKITDLEAEIGSGPVVSVNGQQGVVELDGTDINYSLTKTLNQKIDEVAASIPVVSYPVTSVNTKTGDVVLDGDDIDYAEGVTVNDQIGTNATNIGTNAAAIGDLTTLTTTDKSSLVGAVNELDSDKVNTSDIDTTLDTTSPNPIANSAVATAINGIGFKKASISAGNKALTDLQAFCKTGEKGLLWAMPYVTTPSTGWAFVIFANKIISDSHAEIYIFFNDKITSSYTSNLTATTPTWTTKSVTLS